MKFSVIVLFLVLGTWLLYSAESVTSPHSLQEHLTPPHKSPSVYQKPSDDISFAQKLARWFWYSDEDDTGLKVKLSGKSQPQHKQPKLQQPQQPQHPQENKDASLKSSSTNLMAFWVAPAAQNKHTRHIGGRSEDNCNPCNKFPWVPVPRALPAVPAILSSHGDQFSLTIPAISLQYGAPATGNNSPNPVYGIPTNQNKPAQSFNTDFGGKPPPPPPPPVPSSSTHQTQYNAPAQKPKPSQTYGIPSDLGKIPLSYSNPSSLSYPPNVQYSAPSAPVPQKVHPLLIHTPIPFPSMSQGPLPPLFQYQQFTNDGAVSSYLQPPALSNEHSHLSGEEECRKCSSNDHSPDDSVAAQAQNQETGAQLQKLPNGQTGIEVMKSVPLAEYLSSVEYPMQIVHAPIVDVSDLPKYINLRFPAHKSPSFLQHSGHALFVNHDLKAETSTTSPPDNVLSASSHENQLPEPNQSATVGSISSTPESIPSTSYSSTLQSSSYRVPNIPLTSTARPTFYSTITDLMPPLPDPPQVFFRKYNTSSLEQQSNTLIQAAVPSNMRYLNPPPLKATASPIDWSRPTTSQSFVHSTPTEQRFPSQRPNIVSTPGIKKTKQVHQIIVPYTIKNSKEANFNSQDWTPVPPQGRKVPNEQTGENFQNQNTNFTYNFADLNLGESRPITSTAPEQFDNVKLRNPDENVTPELVSQLLGFEEGNNQNSIRAVVHPGDVHHVLAANLKALLRGEEDNVDLQRLQKNIDNWTAEGYKTNSPPENFHTLSTLGHLSPSKNIPEEYFTTPSIFINHNDDKEPRNKELNGNKEKGYNTIVNANSTQDLGDYETSGTQNHPVRTSQLHFKTTRKPVSEEHESWSLFDTKMKSSISSTFNSITPTVPIALNFTTAIVTTVKPTSTEQTSKAWEQLQVSISPLTKEKVYVVTPQPVGLDFIDSETHPTADHRRIPASITSTRVDRSYSVETGKRSTRSFLHESSTQKARFQDHKDDVPSRPSDSKSGVQPTVKEAAENIDPIEDNRFGVRLVADAKSNRMRRLEDDKGYFRFFPELLKASDYLEDGGHPDQIERVGDDLKRERSS